MEKLTFKEIVKELDNLDISIEQFCEDDYNSEELEQKVGKSELVHDIGGGEGGGEYVEHVYHFIDHDVYARATGGYYSGSGTDWDGNFEEVFPRKVITIAYETKSERGNKEDEA